MDLSLYSKQSEFLQYCESKLEVHVDFNFTPTMNSDIRKLLFGDGNVLLKVNNSSLQQQTLALSIYVYILETIKGVPEMLLRYGNTLVTNALLNIKFKEYQPGFGMVGVDPKDTINDYYNELRYSLRDTETTNTLNAMHLKEDFQNINKFMIPLTQYEVNFAFYGYTKKVSQKYTNLLNNLNVKSKPTCLEFIHDLVKNDVQHYRYCSSNRDFFSYKPRGLYLDDQDNFLLLLGQIENSTFLNTITNDVNKYQYTPREENTDNITIHDKKISTFRSLADYVSINNIHIPSSEYIFSMFGEPEIVTPTPNSLYGVVMKYDIENNKINNVILSNDVVSATKFAAHYEYGAVVEFVKNNNIKYVDSHVDRIRYRTLNKWKGDVVPSNVDCYMSTLVLGYQVFYIIDDGFFNINNIKSIIYNN